MAAAQEVSSDVALVIRTEEFFFIGRRAETLKAFLNGKGSN